MGGTTEMIQENHLAQHLAYSKSLIFFPVIVLLVSLFFQHLSVLNTLEDIGMPS